MPCHDHAVTLDWCRNCKENDEAAEKHAERVAASVRAARSEGFAEGSRAALIDVLAMLEMRATVVNNPATLMAAAKWVRQRLAEIEVTRT